MRLLRTQNQKGQKDTDDSTEFLHFWGSARIKASHKYVDEIVIRRGQKGEEPFEMNINNILTFQFLAQLNFSGP